MLRVISLFLTFMLEPGPTSQTATRAGQNAWEVTLHSTVRLRKTKEGNVFCFPSNMDTWKFSLGPEPNPSIQAPTCISQSQVAEAPEGRMLTPSFITSHTEYPSPTEGGPSLTPLRTQLWGQGGRILKSGRGSWVCFCSEIGYKHWTWNSFVEPGYLVITTGKTSDFCQREMSDIALSYLRATHFFLKSLRKELRKPPFWSCLGFWSLKEVCSLSLSSLGQNRVASSKCISWKHKRGMLFYSFPEYICPGCGTVLGLSTCLSYSPDYLWLVVPTKVCLGHEPSSGKRNTGELGSWGAREFGCSSVHLSINEYKSRQMVPSWTQPSR